MRNKISVQFNIWYENDLFKTIPVSIDLLMLGTWGHYIARFFEVWNIKILNKGVHRLLLYFNWYKLLRDKHIYDKIIVLSVKIVIRNNQWPTQKAWSLRETKTKYKAHVRHKC